ncbi:MAG: phosphatidylinositol mannoside acyltransferase, partial [Betaproteobacteria bacterium]|nr:phosphatidylinositol mannoside acyltransferase [Betaproteobacteria bacterium]
MRYYYETFLITRWPKEEINVRVRAENVEPVRSALKSGGIILTLPHSGNWDLAGAWAALNLGPVATVAERLKPELIFKKFLAIRKKLGISILPLTGESGIYEFLRSHVNA